MKKIFVFVNILLLMASICSCEYFDYLYLTNTTDKSFYAIVDCNSKDGKISKGSEVSFLPPGGRQSFCNNDSGGWCSAVTGEMTIYLVNPDSIKLDETGYFGKKKAAKVKKEYILDTMTISRDELVSEREFTYPKDAYKNERHE